MLSGFFFTGCPWQSPNPAGISRGGDEPSLTTLDTQVPTEVIALQGMGTDPALFWGHSKGRRCFLQHDKKRSLKCLFITWADLEDFYQLSSWFNSG